MADPAVYFPLLISSKKARRRRWRGTQAVIQAKGAGRLLSQVRWVMRRVLKPHTRRYLQHVQLCQFFLQLKSRACHLKSARKSQTWVKRVNCSLAESTCSELVWNGVAALYTNVYLFTSLIGPLKCTSSPLCTKFTFSVPTFLHQRVKELSPNLCCQQSRSLHGCWYWTGHHIVSSSQFPHSLLVTIQNMKGS